LLEHAITNALYRFASEPDLKMLLRDPSPRVQAVCLRLLDQPPRQSLDQKSVVDRVFAPDAALRATALEILRRHQEWAPAAADVATRLIANSPATAETQVAVKELVQAFPQDGSIARLVELVLTQPDQAGDAPLKVALLEGLAQAEQSSSLTDASARGVRAALASAAPDVRAEAVRTVGILQLTQFDAELTALIAEPAASDSTKVEALRVLARRRPALNAAEADVLIRQLDAKHPPLERVAAAEVAALAKLDAERLARLIAAAAIDPLIPPAMILSAAKRSGLAEPTAAPLLAYLKSAVGRGLQLTPEDRQWLAQAISPGQAKLLTELDDAIAGRAARQGEVLAKYTPLLTGGNAERGKSVFFGKASCAACHRVGDQGGTVGPDLTKVGSIRPGRDILESVVLPSASFAQGYEPFVARLASGDTVSGVRVKGRESEQALMLRDSSGAEIRLDKSKVKKLVQSTVSIMPEGLLEALKPDESRDLFAYLQSLR
jgi:putative heme-binding domain-containing protein